MTTMPDTPELPPTDADALHRDIMNLRCAPPSAINEYPADLAYKAGHRDARHAAAELALASRATRLAAAPQGWKPIETAPKDETVLLAAEFDRTGDWRIKCGYRDENEYTGWRVWGASWKPTHWMPLPPAPDAVPAASSPEAADERASAQTTEGEKR